MRRSLLEGHLPSSTITFVKLRILVVVIVGHRLSSNCGSDEDSRGHGRLATSTNVGGGGGGGSNDVARSDATTTTTTSTTITAVESIVVAAAMVVAAVVVAHNNNFYRWRWKQGGRIDEFIIFFRGALEEVVDTSG